MGSLLKGCCVSSWSSMARKRAAATGRLLVALFAAITLWELAGVAFVAPPKTFARAQEIAGTAALAGAIVSTPQSASAVELTFDGWGPTELTALIIPAVFVIFLYAEWE